MAHGTPLGIGDNDERYGAQGTFLIEAGISSSYHIANFFGLTDWIRRSREAAKLAVRETVGEDSSQAAKQTAAAAPLFGPAPELTSVLWPLATPDRPAEPPPKPRRRGIDVGSVITRALTAAGLMK
jgi:hypothetical protein